MTPDALVEAVARALRESFMRRSGNRLHIESMSHEGRAALYDEARAAIEAVRAHDAIRSTQALVADLGKVRDAGAAAERRAIVEWLQGEPTRLEMSPAGIAIAIESGFHVPSVTSALTIPHPENAQYARGRADERRDVVADLNTTEYEGTFKGWVVVDRENVKNLREAFNFDSCADEVCLFFSARLERGAHDPGNSPDFSDSSPSSTRKDP